jgi:8-hydroxy-5-deazaflavin:NADPH oxidoreductase
VSDTQNLEVKIVGIVGGTGKEGKGLAYRWAKAGYEILIGSRQVEKAQAAAEEVLSMLTGVEKIFGAANEDIAERADLVVITVPFAAHKAMLESLKGKLTGKILIDVTVPLVPPKVTKVQMPPAGSASLEAQQILGEDVKVIAAFQNISYENLLHNEDVQCDVLVCGNGKAAKEIVLKLVHDAGLVGWDAGPLENSVVAEGMTSILIGINKQFGAQAAGIQITGVPRPR